VKLKSLIILLLLATGAGLYIHFGVLERAEERLSQDHFFPSDPSLLERISIRPSFEDEIELERRGSRWFVSQPFDDLVSSTTQDQIFSGLRALRIESVLFEGEEYNRRLEDLQQYGLASPSLIVSAYQTADGDFYQLHFGKRNPSGEALYALDPDGERVLLVSSELDFLASYDSMDYRETRLLTVDADHFEEVNIHTLDDEIRLRKEGVTWKMLHPGPYPVDQEFVRNQLSRLAMLRATEFDSSLTGAFEEADIQITIGFEEGVVDRRSDENDPRPHGTLIQITRQKKPGRSGESADHFDYFAKSDKSEPAHTARFHYDNFIKDHRAYVKTSFDDFTESQIKRLTVRNFGEFSAEVERDGERWRKRSESGESEAFTNDEILQSSLNRLRNLRAQHFITSSSESQDMKTYEWWVELKLVDDSHIHFGFRPEKAFTELAYLRDGQILRYSLRETDFDPTVWDLTASPPEDEKDL